MNNSDKNPLLDIPFRIPFDKIEASHVEPAIQTLLAQARQSLESLAAGNGERTFKNTMVRLDRMTEPLDLAVGVVRHLESVATTPELRAVYNKVQPEISAFYSGIVLHPGLWTALKDYAATSEAGTLTGAFKRYLTKTIDDFRRCGADLDPEGKKQLEKLDVDLAQLTTKFAENALDATNAFDLIITDEAGLAGLPPSAIDAAYDSAKSKNSEGWRFTLQGPSYLAAMTYLDDRDVRRQLWHAYSTRASGGKLDNREILGRVLDLRKQKANLLGYRDYADFVTEDRMAHSGDRAEEFLNELYGKTQAAFERENAELAEFRRELEGPGAPAIEPWDVAYYAEKLRKARFDINDEDLRPYFPMAQVVSGLFEIAGRLYGIQVVEKEGVPVWDRAVRYYHVLDRSGEMLGAFYADWYPRENKRGGAWMDHFITGDEDGGHHTPHLGLMCGNLNPPVGGKPSLLTHTEVETIFHEFGHLMHHMLSRVPLRSLSGTSVAWDFVELPSQIMENWCWEREALDLFARHWQTGEPIPQDLFERMQRARTFRAANSQMRQLGFGLTDLALHRHYDPSRDGDPVAYARGMLQKFAPAPLPDDYSMITAFTHLFASPVGYAAGYYSYKWSEVLDADAFTRFRDGGIFSPEVGAEFRNRILSKGDSKDAALLYRDFMGRDPEITALLERQGLA